MLITQLSDIHYCPKHLEWVDKAMAHAIEVIAKAKPEAIVISGDLFDSTMGIHEPAFYHCFNAVNRLSDIAPVLMLYGTMSHDRPGALDAFANIRGVTVVDAPSIEWVNDAPFFMLPSLNKALPEVRELGARGYVQKIFADWAPVAAGIDAPTVLGTHGTINGCHTESNYAMVSPDHEFHLDDLLSVGASATMIGHVHAHQSWTSAETGQVIAYPGSLARLVYGHHKPVGFLMWEVEAQSARFDFIECPSRKLVEIQFSGEPDIEKIKAMELDKDTAVRVRWNVAEEDVHKIDKAAMAQALAAAGEFKLEGSVTPKETRRAAGISGLPGIRDKLARWCELSESEPAPMLDRLEQLLSNAAEDIAK